MKNKKLDHQLKLHVFVCTNERPDGHPRGCCKARGSEAVLAELKKKAALSGMVESVRIQKSGCLDLCEDGPVVVAYPDGKWYGNVTVADVDSLLKDLRS